MIQRIITRSGASAESVGSYAAAHEALARLPRVGESGLAGGAIPGVGDQLAPFALGVGMGPPGAADIVVWRTATAHLLPRLLDGRRTGPVFLTDRRTRVELPPGDLDQASGRARLSYRRAAECFEQATEKLPGGPWELHQLRHSALTHAAEDGANTSTLLAYSGHTSVASLARYARVSPAALARWQESRDPAARRR